MCFLGEVMIVSSLLKTNKTKFPTLSEILQRKTRFSFGFHTKSSDLLIFEEKNHDFPSLFGEPELFAPCPVSKKKYSVGKL